MFFIKFNVTLQQFTWAWREINHTYMPVPQTLVFCFLQSLQITFVISKFSFPHLIKTKIFPHFCPGAVSDLQLGHFSHHVAKCNNMYKARLAWERKIWGNILLRCSFLILYFSLASDSSDTTCTNAKQWACNLCFGSVVYKIQSNVACHNFQISVVYLKWQQHSAQGTHR